MRTALILSLAITATALLAQDADANKQRIEQQARGDIALILPQLGLGGEDTDTLTPLKYSPKEWKPADADAPDPIDAVWCIPDGVDAGHKLPLLITLHGDGGNAKGQAGAVARVSTKEDPVFVAAVGWQNGERSLRGGDVAGFVAQVREMVAAIKKDYTIDSSRIFMHGFSAGCTVTEFYLAEVWEKNPENMDIRAAFFSSKAFDPRKSYPPIPMIQTVGETEDNFYGQDQRGYIRQFCCMARKAGIAVTYHEIPARGHELAPRVLQIIRDHIQAFGGPGCDVYRTARGAQEPAEALPFASDDALVAELIALCRADNWAGALKRAQEIDDDKAIKSRDKKEAKKFPKEMEKYAKKALPELEKKIEEAMKAENFPPGWAVKRLKALSEAYAEESWVSNRSYAELLNRLETEFEPAKREREREELFIRAESLESGQGKWAEAMKLYEDLAARKDEDGGASIWPKAAAYRLKWWVD
ncbi:MAG: hypothetical protein H6839_04425 [Planctomycetes bacterium]|nr:hypothetical protein [Planctomycetota bacterium]